MRSSICLARILRDLFQSSSHYSLACNCLTLQSALPLLLKDIGTTESAWNWTDGCVWKRCSALLPVPIK